MRVLVRIPSQQDSSVVCRLLKEAGLTTEPCADVADLCAKLRQGAGALVVAEETIVADRADPLLGELRAQPGWSDMPILVILGGSHEPSRHRALQPLGESASMILLEEPLRPWTITSAARSALSARRRQYQLRDQLREQQRAEQALRESEEKFRTLAENARASFGIVQGERFVYVNPYFAQVSGYGVEELLTMTFPQLVHPSFIPMMVDRARRRQRGEAIPNHYEFPMVTKSGETRWVEFSVGSILYKGQPAIIGTGFDITERKRAVERLRQNEELMRLSQQAGGVGTFVWQIPAGTVEWSPELERLYGLASGTFGGTYQDWAALVYPEDWPEADRRFHEALQTGVFEAEWRVVAVDGTVHWLAARGWVFRDEQGRPQRMVGVNICITQRKRAEEALRRSEEQRRLAMVAARLGSWDIELASQMCTLDERCREIWAAPDWVTVPMAWIYGRAHPDDREEMAERIRRGADPDGSGMGELEFRIIWPDGQVRWLRAGGHAVFARHNGRPVAVRAVGVTQDITESKRAEQQLRQWSQVLERRVVERTAESEQRAEQLRALASELTHVEQRERRRLAQVLHDHLQQLLVGMKFSAAVLHERLEPGDLRQAAQQISDLLDESLRTARSLTAQLSPPILYDRGLPAALHWLAGWMRDNYRLDVRIQAEDQADPGREDLRVLLYQAVRELLFNVVKHARADHADVTAERCRQTGGIRITVRDQGMGFDPASLAARERAAGGFGLFSIRDRLAVLGGALQIEGKPGHGTSVTVQVPVPADESGRPGAGSGETRPAPAPGE